MNSPKKLLPVQILQQLQHGQVQRIPATNYLDATVHRWSQAEIDALILAVSARRPLLIRGEPGTGKTQLARAAAHQLDWVLHATAIHPRFEASDLLYRFDAVKRLADAQAREPNLQEKNYWEPGPIWKAYNWSLACEYGSCRPKVVDVEAESEPAGHVVLLDEIDKADSDLPNSLLDVLGQRAFEIPALNLQFGAPQQQLPLILITTNEERELPAAFVRRCIVLNLAFDSTLGYEEWLVQRGRAHFAAEGDIPERLSDPIIRLAAKRLAEDRDNAEQAALPPPGLAEFIDLLSALYELAPGDAVTQEAWLKRLSAYAFIKHRPVEGLPDTQQNRPFDSGLPD